MARQWTLISQEGFEKSLHYDTNAPVPAVDDLAPDAVLVKMYAAGLNYRELDIASPGGISGTTKVPLIPACDGAGVVEAVGPSVTAFKPGDRVVTHLYSTTDDEAHYSIADTREMLGMGRDGTLSSMCVFSAGCLIHAPSSLDWLAACTLTSTWTTAWNILLGIEGIQAGPGKYVLVQGTGGVSVAVLQLAISLGATVIATTSSSDRAAKLTSLGAKHVLNYRTNPEWGAEARALTPGGKGFDIIVDVGGNATLGQSLAAVKVNGLVGVIGGVGGDAELVPLFGALLSTCMVRGLIAGSRAQFNDLVRYIDEKKLKPVFDEEVFELADAKEGYRKLNEKRHFAKVVIRIDQ